MSRKRHRKNRERKSRQGGTVPLSFLIENLIAKGELPLVAAEDQKIEEARRIVWLAPPWPLPAPEILSKCRLGVSVSLSFVIEELKATGELPLEGCDVPKS
jgi:hypothetical protein